MANHSRIATVLLSLLAFSDVHAADQLVIWTFPSLSNITNGSSVNATNEVLTGTPTATIRNSDIYASGATGVSYTDFAGVSQPANKALGWSDFKKSGQSVDGQLDLAFNATGRTSMSLRFNYKHDKDDDDSENKLQLRFSTNGGSSFGTPTPFTVTDNNTWKVKSFTLPASLNGQANVVVRIEEDDSTTNSTEVNNILLFDNIELTGTTGGGGGGQSPVLTISSSSASVPASNPVYLCGAIGDTADAARTAISISPADADTTDANLTATVTSSSPSIATGTLSRSSSGGQDTFALTLNPLAVGYTTITVTIADPEAHTSTYMVDYAVSAASSTPVASRYHAGASDASSAIALDANWMLVANDEDQIVRLYDRNFSGQPAKTFDLNANLALAKEADFEGTVRFGNRIYFIGSHGNDKEGNPEPTRNMVCSYDVSGTGTATTLTYVNKFTNLKSQLISWDNSNGHGLGSNALGLSASAASGVLPTDPDGFNIEAATPFGSNVFLGFRAPLQNKTARNKALVIPVTDFQDRVDAGSGTMAFGAPIFLDLGGRSIRSMATMPSGKILILAGLPGETANFMLFSWTGSAASAPVAISSTINSVAINGGGSPEAIVDPPAELAFGSQIQVIQDNGTTVFYGDGIDGKTLATRAFAKSRSDTITITDVPDETPPVLTIPANITREATGPVSTPVTFPVSANDAGNGPVTATATPASGSGFPLGQTTVNVTASDTAGNIANGSFTVTVVDTTDPALTLPANITREATGPGGVTVSFSVSATDIVDLSPALSVSKASGTVFPLGITTVNVSATDDAGNSSTGSFTVTVVDTTAPTLTVPENISAEATGASGAVVGFFTMANDLVGGTIVPTATPASGSVFPLGTTTVYVTASDTAGNAANGSFTITIVDTTAPVLTLPADIIAEATSSAGAVVNFTVSASDAVGGMLAPTVSTASGSVFPIGSTQVTVSATDPSGNPATASFNVLVTGSPEIYVGETGGGEVADNAGSISLGNVILTSSGPAKSFTVRNDGTLSLTLGAITKDGDHPDDFSVTAPVPTTLAPGESTVFSVIFSPAAAGLRGVVLHLGSNDPDVAESVFDILLTGTGVAVVAPAFVAAPVIAPPSGGGGAKFSANVTGTPGATIYLEASIDIGLTDPWAVIAQVMLDDTGHGAFVNVVDPGTVGTIAPTDFFRLRAD
jgi:hypothetical protein